MIAINQELRDRVTAPLCEGEGLIIIGLSAMNIVI